MSKETGVRNVMDRNWQGLLEGVGFYRRIGFFANETELSDEELAKALDKNYRETAIAEGLLQENIEPLWEPISEDAIHPDLRPSNRNLPNWWGDINPDLKLLIQDRTRIWWEDLETDYCPDEDNFVQLLTEWSRISLGAFTPTNIQEHWPEGSEMYLEFDLNGRWHKIVPWKNMPLPPREGFGWTDIEMAFEINKMIRGSGYCFCVADPFDQTAFMFVARIEDKKRMEDERGWKFLGSGE